MKKQAKENYRIFNNQNSSLFGWTQSLDGWTLFLFVFASMFLNGAGQMRFLGLLMTGMALFSYTINSRKLRLLPAPPELCLYTVWVLWAGCHRDFRCCEHRCALGYI